MISRNVWLASGMAETITQVVAAQAATPTARAGRRSRNGLMPQASMAATSRSPDRRPKAMSRATSSDIGMVRPSADGSSVTITRATVVHGTPLAIIVSACAMMKGIIRMKVRTSRASANGASTSRITYRSSVRMRGDRIVPA